ncbi:MAG: transposase [Actinobacteria bacterium]|nr:transposase [Actinomycetota bacterium]
MVRPLRILFKDAVYHVISKGNLGDYILAKDQDKEYFLGQLIKGAEKYNVGVFAYCLMGNHYHLLVQTREKNLPQFMHFLLSSYASYLFREKEKRGHIFAGRYKAILVSTEEYLLTVSKYIHRNPIKAALVSSPSEYKWSSYMYFCDVRGTPKWMSVDWVKDFFGADSRDAMTAYREFVEQDLDKEYEYPYEKVVAQSILGNDDFVKEAVSKHEASIAESGITSRGMLLKDVSLKELFQAVCDHYGVSNLKITTIEEKTTHREARNAFVYLARCHTYSSNAKIAGFLGDIGRTGVSESYRRIIKGMQGNSKSNEDLSRAIEEILIALNGNATVDF